MDFFRARLAFRIWLVAMTSGVVLPASATHLSTQSASDATEESSTLAKPNIVREATSMGSPPPRSTTVKLTGSRNKGGRMAVDAARMWLMEQGLRVVERREDAAQIVVVEYSHPLTVQIRGVDRASGEVRWAGGAHVEGDLDQVDVSILTDVTREALKTAWGLP
jgi:hypothetical protein